MLKSVYEKWEELRKGVINPNDNYIAAYYLGTKSITNLFFALNQEKMSAYIEFTKEVLAEFYIPNIKGMKIEVISADFINPNKKYIKIENDTDNNEIFIAFTSSLADALVDSKSYYDVYEEFKNVVKEYKDYFSNPNHSLSKIEEQGLCAELLELARMIEVKGENALLNWQGPSKNKRDFVFDKSALEVKSTSSQINTSITISNENQLDINYPYNLGKLFLTVYVFEDTDSGVNVISCANTVLELLKSASLRDSFKISLLKLKVDINEYKPKYNFSLQKNVYYEVTNDFPKITKGSIQGEICNVCYRIKVDGLQGFIVGQEDVYEQL